jgi:hypothetical protein
MAESSLGLQKPKNTTQYRGQVTDIPAKIGSIIHTRAILVLYPFIALPSPLLRLKQKLQSENTP